ncbi:alpha/beta hydrolase fold domain-containing protein [Pseudomonas syringae]|uniref:Alpha/beta hydrolase fold domain-containing protein n=1 Tax=Pseudomonas syringae TaxID=317 RepID=A0A9Q3X1V9_PSESX|nr:alpha/beta hydrolase fold domain-containing protein [Pseudomonas syringae]MCF5063631.1 alpha/beta hydrolase fold domain-containing protein [Pseudomonas syringae]MCF5073271.1 alpha/beta hydrolase fold domain-containing protein [Pseudomonas syringae]MCF5120271.1 alpha/beta hydrolase fold domain-containing protein [Pseudomonas syringae]MCF5380333.1 alpha/beta hydrolase fold domain-containing protein [Pseudomonas syringae]
MNTMGKALAGTLLALSINTAFAATGDVEHTTQAFLDVLNAGTGKRMEQLTPKEARAVLTGAQAGVKLTLPKADVSQKTIQVDGQPLNLTIVRPAGVKGTLPVFMFFHGGGWVLGDYPTHERLVRDLVVGSGAVAVFVNYTPSPEAHYPVAINQAYGATKWVAEHGEQINVDGKRLAVAGNSVGGNMAAVVSLMAKDKGTPAIKFQLLLWPVTDANFDTASYNQYAQGHFLTQNMMKWFWDNYTTDANQRAEIYASPLRATTDQLKGLPPALIQTAGADVLRDEGEAYARKLDAAGVPVTAVRYNGMIHDYGLLNVVSQVPAVRSALLQASDELKQHLK